MDAVIIAGGKGTRLKGLFSDLPKVLVPIGGKPLLQWHLEFLKENNIKKVMITLGHLHEKVESFLKDNTPDGMEVVCSIEPKPLGTAGSVTLLKPHLKNSFVVLYGDIYCRFNLDRLVEFHERKKGIGTIISRPNDHPFDSDLMAIDPSRKIIDFFPRPRDPERYYENLVNSAVYILEPEVLDHIPEDTFNDFAKDIFPSLIKKEPVYAYFSPEYFKDVGTPYRIKKVERDIQSGIVQKLMSRRPAIFIDRDGTLNVKKGFVTGPDQFEIYPNTSESIKKINRSGDLALLVTNQSGLARGLFDEKKLKEIHNKLDTLIGNDGAKLDAKYYCPHHPDKGFEGEIPSLKKDCDCRKPKGGMIDWAAKDFEIDLNASVFIGDTWRDIGCGRSRGLLTVGVLSGDADFGESSEYQPDCLVSHFTDAIDIFYNPNTVKLCQEVAERISNINLNDKPVVISIAGQSRSGKSCFSVALCRYLRTLGKKAHLAPLDMWAIPRDKRNDQMTVMDRYPLTKISDDLNQALKGVEVKLCPYLPQTRLISKTEKVLKFAPGEVVILEGVVSHHLQLPDYSVLKVFISNPEETRKSRFEDFYRWKGFENGEIESLYQKRLDDEIPFVEKQKESADFHIKLGVESQVGEEIQ